MLTKVESAPKETRISTALETIIFEDQYPYDLTKVSNSDFLNMTELAYIYIRNKLGSEEELSYESIRMR